MNRIAILASLLFIAPTFAADPLDGLEKDIAKALKSHGVPGVGVAVVQDGKVILARGYGVKEIGKPDPVTEKSLFAIGSVSKSVTACMVAMLVDDKKLEWDDPLRVHLHNFRLDDRVHSDGITLLDCLNHRAGLDRHELLWYGAPYDRAELLFRMRKLKPEAAIRTKFIYNNMLYLAAGEAAAKAAGKSWDDFVAERIFKLVGMTTANTSITKFAKDGDIATPHTKIKGKPSAVPWRNADNIGPAGSINASVADMAEYMKFQLAKGKAKGVRLIERDTFEKMHEPLMLLPKGQLELNPDAKMRSYALGWMVSDYHGTKLVEHGGNIDGMTAQVMLLPEKKIGVVVLANLNGSLLPMSLSYDILDRLLGEESRNLSESTSLLAFAGEFGLEAAAEPDAKFRVSGTKPSFDLGKYAGTYEDYPYAPLKVKMKDGKLLATFNTFEYELDHWHYDTFVGIDRTHVLPKVLFTFDQTSEAGVAAIRFKPLISEEFRFKRVK